jgi:hypothetical protein
MWGKVLKQMFFILVEVVTLKEKNLPCCDLKVTKRLDLHKIVIIIYKKIAVIIFLKKVEYFSFAYIVKLYSKINNIFKN